MMSRWIARTVRAFAFLIVVVPMLASAGSTAAQAGDPYALLDAVNQYRAANGLPPYQMNGTLMIIAQNQSDYQSALGAASHEGPGGTNETQRAMAAGYGGGARVLCDENVAYSWKLSPQGCVEMWAGDAPHLSNLLSTRYVDAGTGATTDSNGRVYYTLDVCYVVGDSVGSPALPPGTPATPWPTLEPFFSVQTVTPGADGAIIHVVKAGQNLNIIAAAYGITVEELKTLNSLASDVIQPGDQLTIRAGEAATPTGKASTTLTLPPATPTRTPTILPQPTITADPSRTQTALAQPAPALQSTEDPQADGDLFGNILLVAIIVLAIAGGIMTLVGGVLKRSS